MNNERAKILIVDDDAMNRAVLSDLLCDEYDIIEAKDGDEALQILEKDATEITLVLLDMVMPGRDGIEVLTARRFLRHSHLESRTLFTARSTRWSCRPECAIRSGFT